MNRDHILAYALPALVAVAVVLGWEWAVAAFEVQPFVLPAPSAIVAAGIENWSSLMASAWITIRTTLAAFAIALTLGVALAVIFSQSRMIERAFLPYAVTLQVTPIAQGGRAG